MSKTVLQVHTFNFDVMDFGRGDGPCVASQDQKIIPMQSSEDILLTLYIDGPASAVLTTARETFQSRYALC